MDFHIPSLATMNNALAFSRVGALRNNGPAFREERQGSRDRSRMTNIFTTRDAELDAERQTMATSRSADRGIDPTARIITPALPKADDFWTTADITSVHGRDLWSVDSPQRGGDDNGFAFFCFELEAPRDIGFTMSMRAADPGPSAFEIVVTGHVVSRHYTVVDRFITRTFTIPTAVLNAGRNALSISTIPGYHGIWIESAGIGPLA